MSTSAVLADANFPSAAIAKSGPELVRADGTATHSCEKCNILYSVPRSWYPCSTQGYDQTITSGQLCSQACNNYYRVVLCVHHLTHRRLVQVMLMDLVPEDKLGGLETPVWGEYKAIINEAEGREVSSRSLTLSLTSTAGLQVQVELIERFLFYERAKQAFAVVATG